MSNIYICKSKIIVVKWHSGLKFFDKPTKIMVRFLSSITCMSYFHKVFYITLCFIVGCTTTPPSAYTSLECVLHCEVVTFIWSFPWHNLLLHGTVFSWSTFSNKVKFDVFRQSYIFLNQNFLFRTSLIRHSQNPQLL